MGTEEARVWQTGDAMNEAMQRDTVEPLWAAIRSHLEAVKHQRYEALVNYPRPIAGCDEVYQQVSDDRDEIARELRRLEDACRIASIDAVDEFLESSTCIDDEAAEKLKAGYRP
jgi:hypothetical protein